MMRATSLSNPATMLMARCDAASASSSLQTVEGREREKRLDLRVPHTHLVRRHGRRGCAGVPERSGYVLVLGGGAAKQKA